MRKVINKMVSEDDLIATVAAAYSHGWRQVKLYFMCGLPTETDEDVLAIADLAKRVIATGREVSGKRDIRCTVSIGGFVPKPHTPFQWAAQCDAETIDARLAKLRDAVRSDRQYGRAIGFRYHDGQPGIIEGLLTRGDRRVGRGDRGGVARRRPVRRLERALLVCALGRVRRAGWPATGVDLDWYTTRERDYAEVLPWDHLDAGLDRDWLWEDWQDALDEVEVEDCRWTPCFDCGVCPSWTPRSRSARPGRSLLPLTPSRASRCRRRRDGRAGGTTRGLRGERRPHPTEPQGDPVADRSVLSGHLRHRGDRNPLQLLAQEGERLAATRADAHQPRDLQPSLAHMPTSCRASQGRRGDQVLQHRSAAACAAAGRGIAAQPPGPGADLQLVLVAFDR